MNRALALAFALTACGGSGSGSTAGGFAGDPFLTVQSDSGALTLALRGDPSPPARGSDAVQLTVTDASGQPVDGLTLAIQPWMPDMGHGSSVSPSVTAKGSGVYEVDDLYLAMPGTWQLRTTITGSVSDHATPSFTIR